jgi:hypothetical protein
MSSVNPLSQLKQLRCRARGRRDHQAGLLVVASDEAQLDFQLFSI